MEQILVNWLLAGFGALFGFLLHVIWDAVKELKVADKELAAEVASINILVAGNYITRTEFDKVIERLFVKLDNIERSISGKVDRE